MKNFLIVIFILTSYYMYSQIPATTNNGKKVILNTDGTWKYATESEAAPPCAYNNTGNITFKNLTNSDIYVYYESNTNIPRVGFVKIKANSSKTIFDLPIFMNLSDTKKQDSWGYVASYELIENTTRIDLREIQGFAKGNFYIKQCENTDYEIE